MVGPWFGLPRWWCPGGSFCPGGFALVVVPGWLCPGGGAGCALVWCAPVVCALVVVPGDGCALVVLPWWLCPGGCALVEVVPLVVVPCLVCPGGGALVADFALVVLPWWLCPGGFALMVVRVVPWFGVPWWFVPWWLYPVMGVPWWSCPGGCALEVVPWWRLCPDDLGGEEGSPVSYRPSRVCVRRAARPLRGLGGEDGAPVHCGPCGYMRGAGCQV